MSKLIKTVAASTQDMLDKTSSTTSRIGHTVERVAKLVKGDVSKRAIAAQLSDNSRNGIEYTVADVETLSKLSQDCESKVGITAKQTLALLNDQTEDGFETVLA